MLAAAGVVASTGPALAATAYYVATNGSNDNPGSFSQPFATINKCYEFVQPGDTCYVRGGTYYALGETYLTRSGTPGNYITIKNYGGETPVLDGSGRDGVAFYYGHGSGSWTIIEGFVIRNYWRSGINIGCCGPDAEAVSNVIVRNNVIDRMGQNGITFMHARDITVENNLVGRTGWDAGTGSWSSNINFYAMYGTNNVARRNVAYHGVDVSSYHTDGNGFICDLTYYNGGCRFENNIAFENGGSGIQTTHSSNTVIVNNTTYDNGKEGTYLYGGTGIGYYGAESLANTVLRNNIAYQSFGEGLRTFGGFTNSRVSNNNITGQSGAQNPQFADPGNVNFALNSGSPSIDAGTSTDAPGNSLVFDGRALLRTTANQPIGWYRYAPDFAYITSRGGVANLFSSASRPQGNAHDQGAYESTGSNNGGGTGGGGTNVITNGAFDSGTNGWWTWFDSGAGVSGSITAQGGTGLDGTALKFDLSNGGGSDWQAQVGQTVNLTAGRTYTLTFKARADSNRPMTVLVQQAASPYTEHLSRTINLTSSSQSLTYTFSPSAGGETYLKFLAGGSSTDLYVDSVALTG
ncbi:carbohydrate binding domain-containing protein [Micromonospora sp. NPDC051300]|uniref:carbohydrate binding domain-containing protein n=1 Tax=Micromonospora sp. NPDC051300 TaxID=3364286 RepID=UPI0037986A7F